MHQTRTIKLIVISDIICPWCYIGQREIELAIAQCSECPVKFEIEYRPYKLNQALKDGQSIDRRLYFETKFGKERVSAMEEVVGAKAKQLGLKMNMLDGVITSTTMAHRLMLKAWRLGGQSLQQAMLAQLFEGYFEHAKNIGDRTVLSEMAEAIDMMSKDEALEFLESSECESEVEAQMAESRMKGVSGVPFVIINERWAVSGGQPADTFAQIFKKLGNTEAKPASPVLITTIPPAPTCGSC